LDFFYPTGVLEVLGKTNFGQTSFFIISLKEKFPSVGFSSNPVIKIAQGEHCHVFWSQKWDVT